jgi:hypothetical protein
MFVVTEEDEAAIRAVYEQRGEFAAALQLRPLFPGITDNAQAREWARTIARWKPLSPGYAPGYDADAGARDLGRGSRSTGAGNQ